MLGEPIRVVLAEDHEVMRAGLRFLLDADPGFSVLAEASEIQTTLTKVAEHLPDVVVLDLNMPGPASLPVIPDLAAQTAVVILSLQNDPAFAREALRAGALGYVLKEAADSELLGAVRAAADGRSYLSPELAGRLRPRAATPAAPDAPRGTGAERSAVHPRPGTESPG